MEARKRNKSASAYQFHFEGGIQSNVRAQIVNELIKYILYERQQIPMTFEQIKRQHTNDSKLQHNQDEIKRQRFSLQTRMHNKKVSDFITKLDRTCCSVYQAFDITPEIMRVAIIIGATPVSPKEVYMIELPPLSPDADNLPAQKCVKMLFQQMIRTDPLCSEKQIHPTNTTILLYAPRLSNIQWFHPKPQYKIPLRGTHVHFQLQSPFEHGNHDLSKNHSLVDLSGFEPLDSSMEDSLLQTSRTNECSMSESQISTASEQDMEGDSSISSATSSKGSNESFITTILSRTSSMSHNLFNTSVGKSDRSLVSQQGQSSPNVAAAKCDYLPSPCEPDFIWFQSPVFIKGYRDKLH